MYGCSFHILIKNFNSIKTVESNYANACLTLTKNYKQNIFTAYTEIFPYDILERFGRKNAAGKFLALKKTFVMKQWRENIFLAYSDVN